LRFGEGYQETPSTKPYQTGRSTYTIGVKLYWEKIGETSSCQK